MNGTEVVDSDQIERAVIASKIGSTVKLGIIRDGRRMTLDVPIVSRTLQRR